MNSQELYEAAGKQCTRPSVRIGDNGPIITGKWGEIEPIGHIFDVWMYNIKNPDLGLSGQRLNVATEKLENITARGRINRLEGELWLRVTDLRDMPVLMAVLGIRKRPRQSEAQRKASAERLKKAK